MICLNSIIDRIGRSSTMLRILSATTPVDSFCEVVRIVGRVLVLSWKSSRCFSPSFSSSAVTRWQYSGSGLSLDLGDEVAHPRGVLLGGAEHQRLLALVDLVHELLHPAPLTVVDDRLRVEVRFR